ncbi:MAG: NAD(P)-dependent oxidoreductase [bacterium]|nr:NAD(P)-dependent oxidoreductase [bacterium]
MNASREKSLITGAGGMLGSYVNFGTRMTRESLDVQDLRSVRTAFREHRPSLVLHLAAATNLIECERRPEMTYRVNTIGTYNVALAAREIGARMFYVSSSAVFDGKKNGPYAEDDLPNPQTHYGHSKYAGELIVAGMGTDCVIARTCWMFGGGPSKDRKFVASILKQLNKPNIEVISGKYGSPTYGKDFIEAVLRLAEEGKTGIFHVANAGAPTRVDVAEEIMRITGSSAKIVEVDASVLEAEYPGAGARGNESVASTRITLRPWQEALAEYIRTEWSGIIQKPHERLRS